MSIPYKVVTKNPYLAQGAPKYYAALTGRSTANLRELCDYIAQTSSFSHADVTGVVHAFINLIPKYLADGRNVCLDGLGIFSVHASSNGRERPEQVTSRDITKLKMTFLPDKRMKLQLKGITFVKAK